MNEILSTIKNIFEDQFFSDKGSKKTDDTLIRDINGFNIRYPNIITDFHSNLKSAFPNVVIENWTQFFNLDRCIRFLIRFDDENRFICQLSIYGYFSVYQSPYYFIDGKYIFGEKKFIEIGEIEVCNRFYECANILPNSIEWLDRKTLNQTVFDLSIKEINYTHIIKVADTLFTNHYL